jgi:hypothetical protein
MLEVVAQSFCIVMLQPLYLLANLNILSLYSLVSFDRQFDSRFHLSSILKEGKQNGISVELYQNLRVTDLKF